MTSSYNILSIGNNPNISFYTWRLYESKLCNLSIINSTTITNDESSPSDQENTSVSFQWNSKQFGNSRYSISTVYNSLTDYVSNTDDNVFLDFVLISSESLQELASFFTEFKVLLKDQFDICNYYPIIVIESTNFVNLEPFVSMSLQNSSIEVFSIMSDYDIRIMGNNIFNIYPSKKESELVYLGRSGTESKYTSNEIESINKISSLLETANVDVFKLNTPLEFLSYQWKFALPKIAIEPLLILFERPFPSQLQEQILAKPLISGLILEIITVIKTMGCKLFKSYDSEDALLKRFNQLYPECHLSIDCSEAPKLYYDFFNQNNLYLDLLLLQPILLADDYHVKTPYLEFLYAIMTQWNNNNFSTLQNQTSIFWLRQNSENIKSLKLSEEQLALNNALKEKNIKEANDKLNQPYPQQQQPVQQQQQQRQVPAQQQPVQQQYPNNQ
ncbi:unnamed protein product [[Candida] boidinii]|uniref:Unnamed protein product n=1 Tax=Candida boidinii TaxID=5477 RepID=A0ACB5TTP7_CANBO|nr:unnamed protein product [[Candida] boidinii]